MNIGLIPGQIQARGNTDHICFLNTAIKYPARILLPKFLCFQGTHQVCIQIDDLIIRQKQHLHRRAKKLCDLRLGSSTVIPQFHLASSISSRFSCSSSSFSACSASWWGKPLQWLLGREEIQEILAPFTVSKTIMWGFYVSSLACLIE